MSYVGFIFKAVAISPFVFLRWIPIVAIFILITVGLFLTTDNIWVIGMIGFLLATLGQTFIYLTGIRGALQTLRLTDAPTVEGLMRVTTRMMISHMLVMALMVFAMTGALTYLLQNLLLSGEAQEASRALTGLLGAVFAFDAEKIAEAAFLLQGFEDNAEPLRTAYLALTLAYQLAIGIAMALFGIPLAAMAANAVQKSPGNDLIFGIGRYFPHQLTLYILATMIPTLFLTSITPVADLTPGGEAQEATPVMLILIAAWSLYAPCVSYAGMALGYGEIQKKVWGRLQRERTPDIDYEAERQNVRALREMRRGKTTETSTYDPRAMVDDMLDVGSDAPMDEDDFEDEVRTSLRAMRQSRRGGGGARMYDPRNPDGDKE